MKKLLLLTLVLIINGCVYKKVDTFEKYCDHINNRNETQAYSWEKDKIKEDFVKYYNNLVLSNIADYNLAGATVSDSAVQWLYENDFIGVKQNGDDLIIMNNFLISENDPIIKEMKVPLEDTFIGFTEKFRSIFINRFKHREETPEAQRCIFAAIGAFYKRIIIQGSTKEEKVEIINEDFEKYK